MVPNSNSGSRDQLVLIVSEEQLAADTGPHSITERESARRERGDKERQSERERERARERARARAGLASIRARD